MGRRIFLDVGGHHGETLTEVIKPRWAFDSIATFEPASRCWSRLEALADERVEIVRAGWWTEDTTMTLHDPGRIGASVYREKAVTTAAEECHFVDAARWLADHVTAGDLVWLKMNCEGAECKVLNHLLDARALPQDLFLLIHFDVEKIPGRAREADPVRARLRAEGVAFREARQIMYGRTFGARTANWLAWTEASRCVRFRLAHVNHWEHAVRGWLYPWKQAVLRRLGRGT